MVAGKDLIQLKDCIQSKLFTLDLTICGEFWLLGQKVTVDKCLHVGLVVDG